MFFIYFNQRYMSFPNIEPIKLRSYTSKQYKYLQCAKLQMRSIVLGSSGSGNNFTSEHGTRYKYELLRSSLHILTKR